MDAKELAKILNGRQYGAEMYSHEKDIAYNNGLVVVFAYSDDNCEFQGAIEEEIPCWNGGKIFFDCKGENFTNAHGEAFLTYHTDKNTPEANMIEAVWCEKECLIHESGGSYCWFYKTDIPHETFDIFEGDRPFCRGIVFSVKDLK